MPSQATKKTEVQASPGHTGRPSLLSPKIQNKIVSAIAVGLTQSEAAQACEISPRTLDRWLALGEQKPDSDYGKFRRAVEQARVASKTKCLSVMHSAVSMGAVPMGLDAAKWLLRNRHGMGLEKATGIHIHTAGDGSTVNVLASDADTLDRLRALQAKRLGEPES